MSTMQMKTRLYQHLKCAVKQGPTPLTFSLAQIVKHNIQLIHQCVRSIRYMPCAKELFIHIH